MRNLEIFKQNLPTDPIGINFDIFFYHQNDRVKMRSLIMQLEDELKQISDIQIQLETTHHFSKGLYTREVFIPKNTVLTGKIHLHENMNICSMGAITIITEDGIKYIQAPYTCGSRAGIKRVGFAHEDTIWTTVHATNETDLEKIEKELFSEEFQIIETQSDELKVQKTMEGFLCQQQS
jgi:hypothetical protein